MSFNKRMFEYSRMYDDDSASDTRRENRKLKTMLAQAWESAVPDHTWRTVSGRPICYLKYGRDVGGKCQIKDRRFRYTEQWIFNGGRKNNFKISHSYYDEGPGTIEYRFEDRKFNRDPFSIDLIGIVLDTKYSWMTPIKPGSHIPIFWSVQDVHDQIAPVIQSFQDNYDSMIKGG